MKTVVLDGMIPIEDFIKSLKEDRVFFGNSLDISKTLREDKTINLELVEVILNEIVKEHKEIKIIGFDDYFLQRSIWTSDSQMTEEFNFILKTIHAMANELYEGDDEVTILWQSHLEI